MNDKQKNYFLSKVLIEAYAQLGVEFAFVSPGSRNTPLMLALSDQKKIEVYNVVDERSSGYMALGAAKMSFSDFTSMNKPALLITTSGTAVSNLFPSVTEAYMSSVPMLILTADRPKHLINTGANQTINQNNIFKGYVSDFIDTSELKDFNQKSISELAVDSYKKSVYNKGPVHINIPFDLPLHIQDRDKIKKSSYKLSKLNLNKVANKKISLPNFKNFSKPLIVCTDNHSLVPVLLSESYNIPLFMECLGARYWEKRENIISSYEFILSHSSVEPDLILRFGPKPISNALNEFIDKRKSITYLITEKPFNDDAENTINCDESSFFKEFIKLKCQYDASWLNGLLAHQHKIENFLKHFFKKPKHHEGYIVNQLISMLPNDGNINLMIGNSSPIRDLDKFTFNEQKYINRVFSNRGVSGIDGLISTSIGLSIGYDPYNRYENAARKRNDNRCNILILGDISFSHDISTLINQRHIPSNLTVIILNNNGGHIFDRLEGLKKEKDYSKYWLTPSDLDIKNIAKAFQCDYMKINYKNLSKINFASQGIKLVEILINSNEHQVVNDLLDKEVKKLFI